MPTININNNTVVVQTAAQWAADTTVYTNKQILVTSDAFWGSTDQRKFKIADGVQTWSNLDYPPFLVSVPTLSQVLASGNTTGDQVISSTDGDSDLFIGDGGEITARVNTTVFQITDQSASLSNGELQLASETASRIAIIDANSKVKSADTATYPSLTELSYVKGVTSAIQTQLDGKGFVMQSASTSVNPADGSTHSFADANIGTLTTYATTVRMYVPKACTLKRVHVYNRNIAGTGETGTFYVVKNGVTDITVSASVVWTGDSAFSNSALNTSFAEGDWFNIKVAYPTWVTNPTSVTYTVSLYFE